jgi:hypothetical protein
VVLAIAQLALLPSQLKAQLNTSGTDVILSCTGPYSGREAVIPTIRVLNPNKLLSSYGCGRMILCKSPVYLEQIALTLGYIVQNTFKCIG